MTTRIETRTAEQEAIICGFITALGEMLPDEIAGRPVKFYDDMGVRDRLITGELTCMHFEVGGTVVRVAIQPLARVVNRTDLGLAS